MGVKGLLKSLRSIEVQKHISDYSGMTLAIDGYAWLHKGAVACPRQLALGLPTSLHIDYIMRRLQLMLDHNVQPYLVFDGDYLPSKAGVEQEREANRRAARARGEELWAQGRQQEALDQFQKCVDISPEMASNVIHVLKQHGIQYVVAPYEADAQMVHLENRGIVQGIIAEDSDLLVFGAKRLLTKMDSQGDLIEISRERFVECKELNLVGVTNAQLRLMAILAGCDYSNGVDRVGIVKANKFVRRFVTLPRVIRAIRLDGSFTIPHDFETVCRRADLTFQYQRVWDADRQLMIHLNDLEEREIDEPGFDSFVGREIDPLLSAKIASGQVDPISKHYIDTNKFVIPKVRLVKRPAIRTIKSFFTPCKSSVGTPSSTGAGTNVKRSATLPLTPLSNSVNRVSSFSHSGPKRQIWASSGSLSTQSDIAKRAKRLLNNDRTIAQSSSDGDESPPSAKNKSPFFASTSASSNRKRLFQDDKENIAPFSEKLSLNQMAKRSKPDSDRRGNFRAQLSTTAANSAADTTIPLHSKPPKTAFRPGSLDQFMYKPKKPSV